MHRATGPRLPISPGVRREDLALVPGVYREIARRLGEQRIQTVSHGESKERAGATRGGIRSGECTPYANIILRSGVAF
ncbi:MAG: hypothetical protein JW820_20045 [Spirochaetales bacterium]|nr:hypothetical protein [Spirochaetales bacterium]